MARPFVKIAISYAVLVILCNPAEGLRILGLMPVHSRSHFNMFEQVMRGLAARGHQVDVYSHYPQKKPVANYTDYSLAGSIQLLSNNMSFDAMNAFSGGATRVSIFHLLQLAGANICELMDLPIFQKLLNQPPNDPPYDLVVVELFMANCYLAWGRHLNIPMIGLATTALWDWVNDPIGNPTNPAVEPSIFSKSITPMNFFERVINVLFTKYVKWSYYYFASHDQDHLVKKYFGPNMPNVIELQKDLSLVLVNYHQALNGIRPFAPIVVPVGFIHVVDNGDPLSKEVQQFLDDSKSGFIYITFGSMVLIETFPKPMLEAFYRTFENIAPVRVLMKIDKPEKLPPGLPSNVLTQRWINQIKVLKHKNIRAFVTHGGLMSTQEAIYHGVPMIGVPLFGDQAFNIESYVRRNMAIKLVREEVTEQTFTKAIKEILNNSVYKKAAEKAGFEIRDVPLSPVDTSTFWIEYIARYGKNALRSPIIDMPWWQAELYDVYGFLILIVIVMLYTVRIILKKLFSLIKNVQTKEKKQ